MFQSPLFFQAALSDGLALYADSTIWENMIVRFFSQHRRSKYKLHQVAVLLVHINIIRQPLERGESPPCCPGESRRTESC